MLAARDAMASDRESREAGPVGSGLLHGAFQCWPGTVRIALQDAQEATHEIRQGLARRSAILRREERIEPVRSFVVARVIQ
jgi:hypothetical protein